MFSFDMAFDQGYAAFEEEIEHGGHYRAKNPHHKDSPEHGAWLEGYETAEQDYISGED